MCGPGRRGRADARCALRSDGINRRLPRAATRGPHWRDGLDVVMPGGVDLVRALARRMDDLPRRMAG
jgi:hypothetical protein